MEEAAKQNGARVLEGQMAVVTGGARGIGLACAQALGEAGAVVALWDVGDLAPAEAHLASLDIAVSTRRVDVSDRRQVGAAVAAVPGGRVDILVTAAGILGSKVDLETVDDEEFDRVLAVNLKGSFWPIQAAIPAMRPHGGKIVCIGSIAGEVGSILSGVPYTATKGGVHAVVKWVAKNFAAEKIYANVVAPGIVETEMTRGKALSPDYCPLGRLGTCDDIAAAVLFLASPASNYVTGTVLNVNGGFFMR